MNENQPYRRRIRPRPNYGPVITPVHAQPTRLWASCWYPWLGNGWVECACGEWFHSRPGVSAATQHERHVAEDHG